MLISNKLFNNIHNDVLVLESTVKILQNTSKYVVSNKERAFENMAVASETCLWMIDVQILLVYSMFFSRRELANEFHRSACNTRDLG